MEGEQPLAHPMHRTHRLSWPILCLITDTTLVDELRLPALAAEAVAGGVNLVQLRDKQLPTRRLLALALELRDRLQPFSVPLLVNSRVDVAFATEAHGVHLPADGLPVAAARRILGPHAIVGRSVHSVEERLAASAEEVDYVEMGTVFPSRSHPGGQSVGLGAIETASAGGVPILAVGGITPENAGAVIGAGAHGVAVISAILGQSDVRGTAQTLADSVRAAWERRCSSP